MGGRHRAGCYLGSRTAFARGSGFIRAVFLVVVVVLVVKLGADVWNEDLAGLFARA